MNKLLEKSRVLPVAILTVLLAHSSANGSPFPQLQRRDIGMSDTSGVSIVLDQVALLGGPHDPVALRPDASIACDNEGRFIVGPTFDAGRIAVYRRNGQYEQSFGAHGSGPGEFQSISRVLSSADGRIHILDNRLRRWTIFNQDLTLDSTVQLPVNALSAVVLPDNTLVVSAIVRSSQGIGQPLHSISREGRARTSFGMISEEVVRPREMMSFIREIAPTGEGMIWSALKTRYEIQLWEDFKFPTLVISRHVSWFPAWREMNPRAPDLEPPQPIIRSVSEDQDRRLWVLFSVAKEDWNPGPFRPDGPAPALSFQDHMKYYDSMIEVIDEKSWSVVASARFPELLISFVEDSYLWSVEEAGDGHVSLRVFRARVVSAAKSEGVCNLEQERTINKSMESEQRAMQLTAAALWR